MKFHHCTLCLKFVQFQKLKKNRNVVLIEFYHIIPLKFRPDTDNIDEYIQKFKELAGLLAYPEDHQVQIFKMMMPENIELRIEDMTTLNECIDEAKVCLTICQPSSLVSRMTTLTLAQSDRAPPTP